MTFVQEGLKAVMSRREAYALGNKLTLKGEQIFMGESQRDFFEEGCSYVLR